MITVQRNDYGCFHSRSCCVEPFANHCTFRRSRCYYKSRHKSGEKGLYIGYYRKESILPDESVYGKLSESSGKRIPTSEK